MCGGKERRHKISVRPLDNLVESQHYYCRQRFTRRMEEIVFLLYSCNSFKQYTPEQYYCDIAGKSGILVAG